MVLSLAAMKCFPIYSCNGGCFGDGHHAKYPTVIFYATSKDAEVLLEAARQAGVGIAHADTGGIIVWANNIRNMHKFADELIKSHSRKRRIMKKA